MKTFLQHAWAIATHDLTYKTDEVSWAKLRVAHQIKAMLEHAELSIEQFQQIAQSNLIAKSHSEYDELNSVISFLSDQWPSSALPRDLQRLAEAVRNAGKILNVTLPQIFESVKQDSFEGSGAQALDLSPFSAIIQSVLRRTALDPKRISKRISAKIAISKTVEIPSYLNGIQDRVFLLY